MADFNETRVGPVENQVISRFDPGEGNVALILAGNVPATASTSRPEGSTLVVDDNALAQSSFYIAGLGFRKGEYTQTLLNCYRVDVPFESNGSITYVPVHVDRRTVYTNWIYVWTDNSGSSQIPNGGNLFVGQISSGSVEPYVVDDGFDYSCSIVGASDSVLFTAYEHPTYKTTDRYNPILGDVMENATEAAGILVQTAGGADKLYVYDTHRNPGIGAVCAGQINVDSSTDSKFVRTLSFVSGFINQMSEETGSEGLQLLDLSYISYKAISASVYVDRYNVSDDSNLAGGKNLVPINVVWKDLQQGNTDEPEAIFFTGRAQLVERSGSFWKIEEIKNRVTVPTTGSILFKIDGTNTVRYTNATVYAPFLNTVYRTDEYGSIIELWNESYEEV